LTMIAKRMDPFLFKNSREASSGCVAI